MKIRFMRNEQVLQFSCYICNKSFDSEADVGAHSLFTHNFYMPQCGTGLAERMYKESIMKYRRIKEKMNTYHPRVMSVIKGKRTVVTYETSNYYNCSKFFRYMERGLRSYHEYTSERKLDRILQKLKQNLVRVNTK